MYLRYAPSEIQMYKADSRTGGKRGRDNAELGHLVKLPCLQEHTPDSSQIVPFKRSERCSNTQRP